jgi:hypothetical protein
VSATVGILVHVSEKRGWLPDDVALLTAGPQLAALLAGVDRSAVSNDDLVRLMQARHRLVAHLNAQLLADMHAVGQRSDESVGATPANEHRWAEVEVAFALSWTHRTAGWQLDLADDLVDRLPAVFQALSNGEIDLPKAKVFSDETINLDMPTARRVTDQLLGDAPRLTTSQLRVRLHKLVLAADPDATSKAAKEKVKGRRVLARLSHDGLAELAGFDLPPHRVAAAMERLSAIARAAKNDGDLRKIDQLRADALLDLLVGEGVAAGGPVTQTTIGEPEPEPEPTPEPARPPVGTPAPVEPDEPDDSVDPDDEELAALWSAGFDQLPKTRPVSEHCPQCGGQAPRGAMPAPRRGVIDLQVPLTTLLGLTDFPGDLAGFGPVIADIARQVVAEQPGATWRFSVYDPLGQLIHHGITRRRPTAPDAAFVKARDRTCRAPGCRAPAKYCDIDHTDEWASSKDSRRCNLAYLCKRHHLFKHLTQSGLVQFTPGILGFTTPLGRHYVTRPDPYLDELEFAKLFNMANTR